MNLHYIDLNKIISFTLKNNHRIEHQETGNPYGKIYGTRAAVEAEITINLDLIIGISNQ